MKMNIQSTSKKRKKEALRLMGKWRKGEGGEGEGKWEMRVGILQRPTRA